MFPGKPKSHFWTVNILFVCHASTIHSEDSYKCWLCTHTSISLPQYPVNWSARKCYGFVAFVIFLFDLWLRFRSLPQLYKLISLYRRRTKQCETPVERERRHIVIWHLSFHCKNCLWAWACRFHSFPSSPTYMGMIAWLILQITQWITNNDNEHFRKYIRYISSENCGHFRVLLESNILRPHI